MLKLMFFISHSLRERVALSLKFLSATHVTKGVNLCYKVGGGAFSQLVRGTCPTKKIDSGKLLVYGSLYCGLLLHHLMRVKIC